MLSFQYCFHGVSCGISCNNTTLVKHNVYTTLGKISVTPFNTELLFSQLEQSRRVCVLTFPCLFLGGFAAAVAEARHRLDVTLAHRWGM